MPIDTLPPHPTPGGDPTVADALLDAPAVDAASDPTVVDATLVAPDGGALPPGGTLPPPPDPPPGASSGASSGDGSRPAVPFRGRDRERRLRRTCDDAYLGGVAGGIARQAGVDPIVVRVVLVVAAIASFGLVASAYAAAWLLVPDDEQDEGPAVRWYREQERSKTSVVLLGLGVLLAAAALGAIWEGIWGGGDGFGSVTVVAIVALAFLFHQGGDRSGRRARRTARSSTTTADDEGDDPDPRRAPVDPAVRARRRRHRHVRNATLVTASSSGAVAATLWATGAWDVSGWVVPAIVLGILLAGLATAPWTGWSWTLTGASLVVLPFLVLASIPGVSLRGGVGDRIHRPHTLSELRDRYQLGLGALEVDLTELPLADGSTTRVRVGLGAGEATVRVPDSVDVRLQGHVSGGTLLVDGEDIDVRGADVDFDRSFPAPHPAPSEIEGTPSDPPQLVIDIQSGFAQVDLIREP